jgi:hypothetical protein
MALHDAHELTVIYSLIGALPRQGIDDLGRGAGSNIPRNGVYLFFERGERICVTGNEYDRVVRVGTHRVDGGLKRRLRQHYRGNKNASTFRRDVGSAMLSRSGVSHDVITTWMGRSRFGRSTETELTELMDSLFTFCCIAIDALQERMRLEQGLIALLASQRYIPVDDEWLGQWAARPVVPATRLWNLEHIDATPLTLDEIPLLTHAISQTLVEAKYPDESPRL